jgi:adenosylcobinamide-GDP ribazoletransferase
VAGYFVHPWHGPLAVVVAATLVLLLIRHTRKRFGGITGDVLGAACETATLAVLAVTAF